MHREGNWESAPHIDVGFEELEEVAELQRCVRFHAAG